MSDTRADTAERRGAPWLWLDARLHQLHLSPVARAQRDGLLWLLPYLMLWTALALSQEVMRLLGAPTPWIALAGTAAQWLRDLLPLVIWGAIGAMAALQFGLARTPVAFVCVAAGMVTHTALAAAVAPWATACAPLVAIAAPYPLVAVLSHFAKCRWLMLAAQPSPAGHNVRDALNLVLPAIAAIGGIAAGTTLLFWLVHQGALLLVPAEALPTSPVALGWLYSVGNSLAWFFGIHGYYLLLPLLESLPEVTGGTDQAFSRTLLGTFVFIGGCGGTLSLVLALLLQRRKPELRLLGLASGAPALINVNELLLFGIPLILNPYFLIPFLLVPACNLLVTSSLVQLGWVAPVTTHVPFNSPVILNALLATDGCLGAVMLQCINVGIGTLIYWPFVDRWITATTAPTALPQLRSSDTEYGQRAEEALFRLDDPVRRLNEGTAEATRLSARMLALGELDFVLHYQPKVDPFTQAPVGCEALLRLVDRDGKTLAPGEFLPDLASAGMLKALDLWVVTAAADQIEGWRQAGAPLLPVAVNLSADSLMDTDWIRRLTAVMARAPGLIHVELTEGALLADQRLVSASIDLLRAAGARVDIDDFGTGYSSLSYLHRFRIDGIKIDRSFTVALAHARGRAVFVELCGLARRLGLHLTVEGIEEAWQLDLLPRYLNLRAQGYFYARPLPADAYAAYLRGTGTG